jgi:predicted transcriptional regulator
MKALWALEKATVHEIRAALLPDRPLAYTTVMTVMDRMTHKGVVEREKRGRAHIYRPAVSEASIRERILHQFVDSFFRGSREALRRHLENAGSAEGQPFAPSPAEIPRVRSAEPQIGKARRASEDIDPSLL